MRSLATKIIIACAGLMAGLALHAADFEGTLQVAMATATVKTTGTGYLKGLHFKLVPTTAIQVQEGVEGYPVINFEKKIVTLMAPKDKYYLDMPLAQFETAIDKLKITIKPSGQTATILGHAAEEWVLDDPAKPYGLSLWVTKELSIRINPFVSLQKTSPDEGLVLGRMGKELAEQGCFPLKAQAVSKKGVVTLDWAVSKIEPKAIDDQEFAIPEGWVKMSEFLKKNKKPKGR